MDNKEDIHKEDFKSAIASTVKSISAQPDIKITFENKDNNDENTINLPEIKELKSIEEYSTIRAIADSKALKIRYTDKLIYNQNEPSGKLEKKLYETAEKIRYEKLGSNYFAGVKHNLDFYLMSYLCDSHQ